MTADPVSSIAGAVQALFKWLVYSQNEDRIARRNARIDLKKKTIIVKRLTKLRLWQKDLELIPPNSKQNIKRRKILKRKIEAYQSDIDRRLGIDG